MSTRLSRFAFIAVVLFACVFASINFLLAQAPDPTPAPPKFYAGRNINMVSGIKLKNPAPNDNRVFLGGDPYLQRQNEPSVAVSTRNPMHIMAGANDYRTVDMPGLPNESVTGDSWLGLYKSFDGGQTWQSTLMPGFPQAQYTWEGNNSPIYGFAAAADPTVRAGTNGMFYYSGVAFNRGTNAKSSIFVSRFIDLNNREGATFDVPKNEDSIKYISATVIDTGTSGQFMDKPWLAVDIPRNGSTTANLSIPDFSKNAQGQDVPITVAQQFACGNVYIAYASFLGHDIDNPHTRINVARSTDCGKTWSKPVKVSEGYQLNQGATIAVDPASGAVYVAWQVFTGASGQPSAVMIAKSTDRGQKFGKAVQVAQTMPFNQPTRPSPEVPDDSFRLFRTNAFPTLAIDGNGRIYAAWSERGSWGNDNLEPKDGNPDGSRIVVSSSSNGNSWGNRQVIDNGSTAQPGFQIMPSLSYSGGKLSLLFYDFRDDYYHKLFDSILKNEDGTYIPPAQIDLSFPPGDAAVFDPFPVRHTVEVRVATADVENGSAAVFGPSQRVSRYLSTLVPYSDSLPGEPVEIDRFDEVQLQSNQINLPLFSRGKSPFIGDYIEIAGSPSFVPDPNNPGKWIYNNNLRDASVFHAVWADNRNVMPPPAKITKGYDKDGNGVIDEAEEEISVVERPDWTKYSPPSTSAGSQCNSETYPGMRNQDIYSSRITQGLVLGSYGNAKPLNIERAFSIFVENTTPETPPVYVATPEPHLEYAPSSRYFRLTLDAPVGVFACFKYFSPTAPSCSAEDTYRVVEVHNLAKVAATVFAIATTPASLKARVKVLAEEISAGGSELSEGLKSTLVLNPDSSNPEPINVDQMNIRLDQEETHDPEYIPFSCQDFSPLSMAGVISNCEQGTPPVERLVIQWPSIVNPLNPALLNPALLNTTENPALLNPALLNPALLNPALLNPALLNPALLNPALLNNAQNPALLNPALLNPALLNPALLNPALLNPALLNDAQQNPALLNPALLNPALLNPALLNNPLDEQGFKALEYIAKSSILIQGTDLATINNNLPHPSPTTLTDITWNMKNIGNDASSFFFTWYKNLNLDVEPEQILIYRTYQTPSVDLNKCLLNEAGLHYEFLANILKPNLLTPAQMNRALTFSVAPEDHVYITLRFKDPDGPLGSGGLDVEEAQQIVITVVPEAPPIPSPTDPPAPIPAPTATALLISPSPLVSGNQATFTATVFSVDGAPNVGTVTFKEGATEWGPVPVSNGQASFTTTAPLSTDVFGIAAFDNLIIDRGGWDYTLSASLDNPLFTSTSTPFDVVGFRETGSMGTARHSHTSTLLPNGKILVSGGYGDEVLDPYDPYLSSSELYDPATGAWTSTTGSLGEKRTGHTATLLPNGKVLVAGGVTDEFISLDSAELYDPAIGPTGSWSSAGSMDTERGYHTATLLANGKVLVAGGGSDDESTELYDPAADTWSESGDLSFGRTGHTATLLADGKVLVVGGVGESIFLPGAELYDPASGLWSSVGSHPATIDRYLHTATLLPNGKVLVAGGMDADNDLASAVLYDPAAGTWASTGSLTTERHSHTATLLPDGKVLVAGGEISDDPRLDSAELYDPVTGTWIVTSNMTSSRAGHTTTLLPNGIVLFAGGRDDFSIASSELFYPSRVHLVFTMQPVNGTAGAAMPSVQARAVDRLGNGIDGVTIRVRIVPSTCPTCVLSGATIVDTAGGGYANFTNLILSKGGYGYRLTASAASLGIMTASTLFDVAGFCETGSLGSARLQHTATLLPNGKVLIAGGVQTYGGPPLNTAELYDPVSGAWTSTTNNLAIARKGHVAILLSDGRVMVTGGNNGSGDVGSVEYFNSSTRSWTTGEDGLGFPRTAPTGTLLLNGKVLVAGGFINGDPSPVSEIYDPSSDTLTLSGLLNYERGDHSAVLLPDGRVLAAGGSYASGTLDRAEIYDPNFSGGTWWTNTGSMKSRRAEASALLLPSGRVLMIGGRIGVNPIVTTELYDPATGTWTLTGNLNVPRFASTATLLPNGKVLVTGGTDIVEYLFDSAEIYDPATGTWSLTGSLSVERAWHSATPLHNGTILIVGWGRSAELFYPLDPPFQNPGFSYTASMNTARSEHTATRLPNGAFVYTGSMSARAGHTATLLPNGKVIIAGGQPTSSTDLYDPAAGTFTFGGNMTEARVHPTATLLLNGMVLVVGGYNDSDGYLRTGALYDPNYGGTWYGSGAGGWMTTARYKHTATLLPDGTVLVVGGYNGSNLLSAELYDPEYYSWSPTNNTMSTARSGHIAILMPNGLVLIAGGGTNKAEIYNPQTKTFSATGSMSVPRTHFSATLLPNGKVLVAGGSCGPINPSLCGGISAEIYDPATGAFSLIDNMSAPRMSHAAAILPDGTVLITGGYDGSNDLNSSEIYRPGH